MGRPGRYTLSVMAWVAAYAGWSSVIGLVVAALTGDQPRAEVSTGVSALLTVVGPLVPTLVALWFNDWARDGFPTREQQRAARTATTAATADGAPTEGEGSAAEAAVGGVAPTTPAPAAPQPAVPATVAAPPGAPVAAAPRTVPAHPLGVPSAPVPPVAPAGAFPVAPLLRDGD